MVDRHFALAREEIIEALTSYTGMTTADGATPANNTLEDSFLKGRNDFITGKTILIGAGYDTSYEDKGASSFDPLTGIITVTAGFSHQIKAVTTYRVLNLSSSSSLSALLNAIKAQTDKLAGKAVVEGTVTANWNTSTGTSGEAGEDLLGGASAEGAIGAAATKYKLHSLLLDVSALADGANINVKLFMKINGNERKVYDQAFIVPTTAAGETPPPDTLGLWIVNGTVTIHDELRVEVFSDTNEPVPIAFTYVLEAM